MSRPLTDQELEETIREARSDINVPWLYRWTSIAHYYGDSVRQLFMLAAAVMLFCAPFYTDNLQSEFPFIVFGTVVLVAVAAITNPIKLGAIRFDVVVAGVGLVIFESWALLSYQESLMHQFVIREALALIFLFALYFSTKTLRSMIMHRVGRVDSFWEYETATDAQKVTEHSMDWKKEAREALNDLNDKEKLDFND